jgi:spermidine/putrescine transport system ATP-binding protein
LLQLGNSSDIYDNPNCRFVADFIGETNFINGKIKRLDGRVAEVTVGDGLILRVDCAQTIATGTEVSVAVRPEKMHVKAVDRSGLENTCQGRVSSVVYIGTDTHYGIEIAGGQKVRVREQNNMPGSLPVAQVGEEVTVSFAIAAGRILTE